LRRGLVQIPLGRSNGSRCSARSIRQRGLETLLVMCPLTLLLSACDPGRTRSLVVALDSESGGGIAGVVSHSNLVESILSEIDAIAVEKGFSRREDRLLEQRRYYPATVRYYAQPRAHAPGQVILQVQHNTDRNAIGIYLTEFPSGRREKVFEETYETLTGSLGKFGRLSVGQRGEPRVGSHDSRFGSDGDDVDE